MPSLGGKNAPVYIEEEDGSTIEWEIANIGGLPHEIKRNMTLVDEEGNITLDPKYLGKVISINGQSLSHKTLRFMHATIYKNDLNIKDKNPIDCTYSRKSLEDMILIRGK